MRVGGRLLDDILCNQHFSRFFFSLTLSLNNEKVGVTFLNLDKTQNKRVSRMQSIATLNNALSDELKRLIVLQDINKK